MAGVEDFFSGVLGAMNTAYNLYTNQRDFDYQKALQQQIFQREDTAVQRRMADLKAAGINPNLAAGSVASAGSVVSRSNTNDVNMGSALDMIQAANQVRMQKQQVENAKVERANALITNQILKDKEYVADNEKYISMASTLAQLGIPFNTVINADDNEFDMYVSAPQNGTGKFVYSGKNSPLQKLLDYQTSQQMNSATLLQNDVDFYTGDKAMGYLGAILNILNKLK